MSRRFDRKHIIYGVIALSIPVMLFFQNCGQAGSVQMNDSLAANVDLEQSGVDNNFIIVPPEDDHQIVLDDPPLNEHENHLPNEGMPSVPTSSVASEVSQVNNEDDDEEDSTENDSTPGSVRCGNLVISDMLLNVIEIRASQKNDKHEDKNEKGKGPQHNKNHHFSLFQVIDEKPIITLDKQSLKVKAVANAEIKKLKMILSSKGNKILSSSNVAMEIKTPSGQKAGIKVKLQDEVSVKKGEIYTLELVINPAEQFVRNHRKCIFKPVIKEASLSK